VHRYRNIQTWTPAFDRQLLSEEFRPALRGILLALDRLDAGGPDAVAAYPLKAMLMSAAASGGDTSLWAIDVPDTDAHVSFRITPDGRYRMLECWLEPGR
jgi:hypothetical protein